MKPKNLILLPIMLGLLILVGCTPYLPVIIDEEIDNNEEIDYNQEIELTGLKYDKLSYLLEGMIDIKNDKPDIWNKPLNSDEQKGRFIYNILNNNYMDKYENPFEATENPYYPTLEDLFIVNDGDVHDFVFPVDAEVKVAYKKSDIDKIMTDIVGDTLKDGNKIRQEGLILSGDKYLFFSYRYYGSDLIGNKGRATRFEISSIKQASEKDIEVKATYYDDALQDGENYEELPCDLIYHISKNSNSFYGYTVNEYMYSGCELDKYYVPSELPSQLVYGIDDGIYSDYITLKRGFETREKNIDLNGDGTEEYFAIGPDSPNGTKILGVVGDQGYNFIYDFTHELVDDYNELLDGLFVEIYFEDFNEGDGMKEILVAIGDKKTFVEAIEYRLPVIPGENTFEKIGHFYGKSYLEYDSDTQILHAPYSDNGVCKTYDLSSDRIFEL